jgi:hypothetical protein
MEPMQVDFIGIVDQIEQLAKWFLQKEARSPHFMSKTPSLYTWPGVMPRFYN